MKNGGDLEAIAPCSPATRLWIDDAVRRRENSVLVCRNSAVEHLFGFTFTIQDQRFHAGRRHSATAQGTLAMPNLSQAKYVPAGTGPMYCGPGDRVSFLVTGADSHGSCLIVEGVVAPGGGPPPHFHHNEDETFYLLEGAITFQAGGRTIHGKPGDCVHVPRGTVHSLKNEGTTPAKALVVISPAGPTGMQQFFEESFIPTTDREAPLPPMSEELMNRMMAAAARNGMEWVQAV
jgi:quercetin dioxygenase-like cupin family protein